MPSLEQRRKAAEDRAAIAAARKAAARDQIATKLLKDAQARFKNEDARRRARGPVAAAGSFATTRRGRLRDGRTPLRGSADSHRDPQTRDSLRRQAQDAYRTNWLIRPLVCRKVQLLLGEGPRLSHQAADRQWAQQAQDLFDDWAYGEHEQTRQTGGPGGCELSGRHTLDDLLAQAIVAAHTDGRMLGLLVDDPHFDRPAIQVVEDERCINPGNAINGRRTGPDGEYDLVNGVEMTLSRRVLRYHIAEYYQDGSHVKTDTRPVEARFVLDFAAPTLDTPNLIAPEPLLQSVLPLVDWMEDSIESTVIAYDIATRFGALVHGDSAEITAQRFLETSLEDRLDPDVRAALASGDPGEVLLPRGSIHHVGAGNITQMKPEHPSQALDQFVQMVLGLACSALDMSLDSVQFAYDGSWSASRARLSMTWRAASAWRRWLHAHLHAITRWRLARAIADGDLPFTPDWDRFHWRLAAMPQLEPSKEIDAALKAVNGRLRTREQALEDLGYYDIDEVFEGLGREQRAMAEQGIQELPMPGSTVGKDAEQARSNTESTESTESTEKSGD